MEAVDGMSNIELTEEMMPTLLSIIQAPLQFEPYNRYALSAISKLTLNNPDEKREVLHCILEGIGSHDPNAPVIDKYLKTIRKLKLEKLCSDKAVFATLCSIVTARMASKPTGPAADAMLISWRDLPSRSRKAENIIWRILNTAMTKGKVSNFNFMLPLLIDRENGCLYQYHLDLLNSHRRARKNTFDNYGKERKMDYEALQDVVRTVARFCSDDWLHQFEKKADAFVTMYPIFHK